MCVLEQLKSAKWGKGWIVPWGSLGCASCFFSSCWTWATSKMGGGCEFLWGRRSGVSKANSRSGLVCLLGEVLDFCDRRSCETASELFDFCDNISWDVAAELLLWGVMFCKRSSNGSWRDGGKLFSFCMFWTTEDAFPGVLFCFCSCCFANHAWNSFCCPVFGAKAKPWPVTLKMGISFAAVAFLGGWFWVGLGFVLTL